MHIKTTKISYSKPTRNSLFTLLFLSYTIYCPLYSNTHNNINNNLQNNTLANINNNTAHYITDNQTPDNQVQELLKAGHSALYAGDINNAVTIYETLLAEYPSLADINKTEAQHKLAYAYKIEGHPEKAIPLYSEIIARNPKAIKYLRALSYAYLSQGDYTNGWKIQLQSHPQKYNKLQSLIQKKEIAHKKILLMYQGGLGDTIHFIRYAERLKELGATVIACVQTPLVPLLSRCPFIDTCINIKPKNPVHSFSATAASVNCDIYAYIMNLPALFEDTESTIPHNIPYIFPDPLLIKKWGKIINKTTYNIGLCWHPDTHNDQSRLPIAKRDIPLTIFEKLQDIPNVHFYSLQKKDGLNQINQLNQISPHFPLTVIDDTLLDSDHGPFMDTAAIIANLDLVITIDSAVAHLAGALGKQVWLLLPYATDWRWLANRTDSPWYPTMRIFKQPAPFDWDSVVQNVYTELCLASKNKINK